MTTKTTIMMVMAIVSALAVFGVVVVTVVAVTIPLQEAEAGCERGLAVNQSLQKSNGRCFDRGTF
jgi:hypothetical protein